MPFINNNTYKYIVYYIMPTQIDVFQLTPTATEDDIQLCIEWIKAQIKAK